MTLLAESEYQFCTSKNYKWISCEAVLFTISALSFSTFFSIFDIIPHLYLSKSLYFGIIIYRELYLLSLIFILGNVHAIIPCFRLLFSDCFVKVSTFFQNCRLNFCVAQCWRSFPNSNVNKLDGDVFKSYEYFASKNWSNYADCVHTFKGNTT